MSRCRLDQALVRAGLADNLDLARSYIMEGRVYVGQTRLDKPSLPVEEGAALGLRPVAPYVSRGGLKLEKAINCFGLDLAGKVCLDVGSSTGGFTDCMLQNGAARVFAIDVGYGLLDWRLREDARVTVLERTNARRLTVELLGGARGDFASMDVSFISVKAVLPAVCHCLTETAELAVLVKPQFEAPRGQVGKGGVVRDAAVHRRVLEEVMAFAPSTGFTPAHLTPSPIRGTDGNVEFLLHLVRGGRPALDGALLQEALEQAARMGEGPGTNPLV